MARYKTIDLSPRFLAVDLEKQLLPGSFAHAVHYPRYPRGRGLDLDSEKDERWTKKARKKGAVNG
jgi:hypothetical protein